jgi:hypothetical protein
MKRKPHSRRKRTSTKSVLRLPDLEHAKTAVLNSLTSLDAQRGYRHAIDEFVDCGLDQPLMIVLASSRILELGDGCGRVADDLGVIRSDRAPPPFVDGLLPTEGKMLHPTPAGMSSD